MLRKLQLSLSTYSSGAAKIASVRMVGAIAGFVSTLLVTRLLSKDDYGTYTMILVVLAYFQHISEFGLRTVALTRMSVNPEKAIQILGVSSYMRLLLSLLAYVLFIGVCTTAFNVSATGITVVGLVLFVMAFNWDYFLLSKGLHFKFAVPLMARTISYLGLLAALALSEFREINDVLLLYLMSWVLCAILSILTVRREVGYVPKLVSSFRIDYLKSGSQVALNTLLNHTTKSADVLIVGAIFGASMAGEYGVAMVFVTVGFLYLNALHQMVVSTFASFSNDAKTFTNMLSERLVETALIASLVVVLVYAAVHVTVGNFFADYSYATEIVLKMLPYVYVCHLSNVVFAAFISIEKTSLVFKSSLLRVVLLLPVALMSSTTMDIAYIVYGKASIECVGLFYVFLRSDRNFTQGLSRLTLAILAVFTGAYLLADCLLSWT